jgi:acyl-CoA thioesterase FadM
VDEAALQARREAIVALGESVHALIQAAVASEVPTEELTRAARLVGDATAPLSASLRGRFDLPRADDLFAGLRLYNPVIGAGNPLSPPLQVNVVDGVAVGVCTLGLAFEGPPTYVHGGYSAMLLDQMLGHAIAAAQHPGMTVELSTRYRRPVPLATPLHLTAQVTGVDGRRIFGIATIATAAEPSVVLVEAHGTFVALNPEQSRRLFASAVGNDS